MSIAYKLVAIAVVWSIGIYSSMNARSNAAGQGYAEAIPILFATVITAPIGVWIIFSARKDGERKSKLEYCIRSIPFLLCIAPVGLFIISAIAMIVFESLGFSEGSHIEVHTED